MFKNTLTLLGTGLVVLWIVGLAVTVSTPYMTWLDGVGGLLCFMLAGSLPLNATRAARATSAIILSLCLFGLWIGGLLGAAVGWQVWLTFVAACICLVIGIASAFAGPSSGVTVEERERPRRVA